MLSGKQKFQLFAAFATLLTLALSVGCHGFFTNPTLTAIAVGPQATINQGTQVQMTAVGTYNDGTENTIQSGVNWSTSDQTIATINTGGLVTGVSPGSATITASDQAVNGSTTVTVTITGLTAIQVTPLNTTVKGSGTVQYKATGTVNGKQEDLTDIVTWSTSDTTGLVDISSTGLATITTDPTQQTVVTITATEGSVQGTATLTCNP
jgi:uncharacterized protein YjdB